MILSTVAPCPPPLFVRSQNEGQVGEGSWVQPDHDHAEIGLDDHAAGMVRGACQGREVNLMAEIKLTAQLASDAELALFIKAARTQPSGIRRRRMKRLDKRPGGFLTFVFERRALAEWAKR